MTSAAESTVGRVSVDSGQPWTVEGAWQVAPGVYRMPLPLPMDGLRAVNVYAIEGPEGLALIDGGWAINEGRESLERQLARIGAGFGDITQFLVTHVHRDHYTLAATLGSEHHAKVSLGRKDRPTLDLLLQGGDAGRSETVVELIRAGAFEFAERFGRFDLPSLEPEQWRLPDAWLDDGDCIELGPRALRTVHTPGHTPGHVVFVEDADKLLFAGDHVLPTITPSIGYVTPFPHDPLGDFMSSLARVRALPDLRILPAHGPVAPSSHARVDELLLHHDDRLQLCLIAVVSGRSTAYEVAQTLTWTRHARSFDELGFFDRMLATHECLAHLKVLASRGNITMTLTEGVLLFGSPGTES